MARRNNSGSLSVWFKKRNGGLFRKTFKSRSSKARAIRAWRNRGGKIHSSY